MYPDVLKLVWRTKRGQTDRELSLSNGKISLKLLNPFNKLDMSKFRRSVVKLLITLGILKLRIHYIEIENGLWNFYWTNISDLIQDNYCICNKKGLSNFSQVVISVSLKRVNIILLNVKRLRENVMCPTGLLRLCNNGWSTGAWGYESVQWTGSFTGLFFADLFVVQH